jgi:hypothetical protein
MAQSKCSAFKSVIQVEKISKPSTAPENTTPAEIRDKDNFKLKLKQEKQDIQTRIGNQSNNENNSFEYLSSSSSTSSCSSVSSNLSVSKEQIIPAPINIPSATISSSSSSLFSNNHSQSPSPFYVDKIFNFQNMFLFSSNATSTLPEKSKSPNVSSFTSPSISNSQHGIQIGKADINLHNSINESHSALLAPLFNHLQNNLDEHLIFDRANNNLQNTKLQNELHSIMHQNLIQNYYNMLSLNQQSIAKASPENLSVKNETIVPKVTNNFSIERILSLPTNQHQINQHRKLSSLANILPHHNSMTNLNPQLNSREKSRSFANNSNISSSSYLANFTQFQPPIAITAPAPSEVMLKAAKSNTNACHRAEKLTLSSHPASNVQPQQTVVKSKNAKKYKCDLCGRGFSRSNTLITHRVRIFLL